MMKGIDSSLALSQPSGQITCFRKPTLPTPASSPNVPPAVPAGDGDTAGSGRGKGKGRGRGRGAPQNQRTPKFLSHICEIFRRSSKTMFFQSMTQYHLESPVSLVLCLYTFNWLFDPWPQGPCLILAQSLWPQDNGWSHSF